MPRDCYVGFALAYDPEMVCHLLVFKEDQHTLIMLLYFHLLADKPLRDGIAIGVQVDVPRHINNPMNGVIHRRQVRGAMV